MTLSAGRARGPDRRAVGRRKRRAGRRTLGPSGRRLAQLGRHERAAAQEDDPDRHDHEGDTLDGHPARVVAQALAELMDLNGDASVILGLRS